MAGGGGLKTDPRFAAVETSIMTHPSLRAYGEVPDEEALQDLQQLMQAPPNADFHVIIDVKVAHGAATRPVQ